MMNILSYEVSTERGHGQTKGADEIISHAKLSPHPKKTYDPRH